MYDPLLLATQFNIHGSEHWSIICSDRFALASVSHNAFQWAYDPHSRQRGIYLYSHSLSGAIIHYIEGPELMDDYGVLFP